LAPILVPLISAAPSSISRMHGTLPSLQVWIKMYFWCISRVITVMGILTSFPSTANDVRVKGSSRTTGKKAFVSYDFGHLCVSGIYNHNEHLSRTFHTTVKQNMETARRSAKIFWFKKSSVGRERD
jgi:hypothetical protein